MFQNSIFKSIYVLLDKHAYINQNTLFESSKVPITMVKTKDHKWLQFSVVI